MKLFYGIIENGNVVIADEEQQHIVKVLRLQDGDQISVTDGAGQVAHGRLNLEGKKAGLSVEKLEENLPRFSPQLHIAIAPTKNIDRIEFFIEKATELGISEITLINTEQTERKNVNLEKLRKQSVSASKQSQRFHFPRINELTKFLDFIKTLDSERTFVAHCNEKLQRIDLNEINPGEKITFLIGPEGDFSEKEIELLAEHGVKAVSLGNQRLRTETAGVFVAAWNYLKF